MKRIVFLEAALGAAYVVLLGGCGRVATAQDPGSEDPPPAEVVHVLGDGVVSVSHPERFALSTALLHVSVPELKATGVVTADISRNVPVISMASGRIIEIDARLGDTVAKGQLLMRVQSADLSQAFSDYKQAVADKTLAQAQLDRSMILFDKGAIAKKDLEVAQDLKEKADVTVDTTVERLRVLGADKDHPTSVVDVSAPITGVITDQQVTAAAGTQGLASPNAFTISDISHVWILCDVYENDLAFIHIGGSAEVRLNAYPGMILKGRIGNIGAVLDPNIRTAKVRIEMENPGSMRLGMFVQTTFHGQQQARTVVPASAILHLHDRDWVYVAQAGNIFRRVEVIAGPMASAAQQEVQSGIRPGQRVVVNALDLQNTSDN